MQQPPKAMQTATPQELAFPDEAFRKEQPKAGAPRPFRLPPVKPFTLKNGIKVYLVEQHALPIVSMDLNFDGGIDDRSEGQGGTRERAAWHAHRGHRASSTRSVRRGARRRRVEHRDTYAADDSVGISLSSLTKHLDTTFALFVETLRSPGMRPSDFDRMIKRRIEAVKQSKGSPASVAGRVTGTVLYGAEHPFGTVITEESLGEDHDRRLQGVRTSVLPAEGRAAVRGRRYDRGAGPRATSTAARSRRGRARRPSSPRCPRPRRMTGRMFFVDIPNAAQSQVTMLHFGPKRTAPDYFATTMMSAVFGGSFSSRINMNLREEKGYAYGARGGFAYPSRQYGTFSVSSSVQADSTYQTSSRSTAR